MDKKKSKGHYSKSRTIDWTERKYLLKIEPPSPLQLFQLFCDDEIFDIIIKETNIYAGQNNIDFQLDVHFHTKCFKLKHEEIFLFI
ncbi:hypothetical protein FF38_09737 [Lucilia cuprina]|uniref:PiggyBac transposable element-derived protein domain-containing protein n=1 Tax=Lucilia cuprina TaxID=7375 RepID=A0A0L0CGN1_LUCCU|nr:hypothetical protein FF38_09737 [Lucilia cuprina]